jgi:ATP:ADP antiporter, AAA family
MAACIFIATAFLLTTVATDDDIAEAPPERAVASAADGSAAMRREPFLYRIAAMVALSTAAVLTVDYFFKSTAAHVVPAAQLASFFARYYAAMNGVSLVVQLLVASRLVQRLGVAGASCVMPFLLMGGGVGALLAGGTLLAAIGMKTIDGGLRYSLNRVSTELLYLPVAAEARNRGKAFIDGVLGRLVQALTGGALYFLALSRLDSPRVLAAIVVALSAAWFATAFTLRAPYLDLFRRAIVRGSLDVASNADDLDFASAEALVEALASPDPRQVVSAMDVLVQKHRAKLIPALILYHEEESVLVRALDIFADSPRRDWISIGARLLSDGREAVRIAVVRALGRTSLRRSSLGASRYRPPIDGASTHCDDDPRSR